jgi:HK97 family phage major capsid protein
MELSEIITKIEALESRASELLDKADGAPAEDVKALRETVETDIVPEIKRLQEARADAERAEEVKALRAKITTLDEVINDLKKPMGDFHIGSKSVEEVQAEASPYDDGSISFYSDVKAANKGRMDAQERLSSFGVAGGKAMTEGDMTGAGHTYGGYLVEKQIERQIVEARELDNVLRGLCSKLNVTGSGELQLDQISLATTAGWVAELAEKPEATSIARTSVSASIFTAAGLATISNQLLADANPAVDRLVTADLAKRLVALEEAAFLAGTGSGQPLGLLNTPGLQTQGITVTGVTADGGLLDAILDAIGLVQAEHGEPTAILMHPRTWTRVLKAKDAAGIYLVGPESVQSPRTSNKSIWGVPVVTSNRVPTNLGAGTNESRVIVGDFTEALILDRQGITVDESQHVKFTSNQTIFRAEQRVGFTAARAPKAFAVVGGTGLANG